MTILKKILSHALIVLGGMFLVFSIINFLNDAMNFLNNEISLVLLLIWAVLSMVTGGVFVADMLKKEADTAKKAKPRSTREHRAARRSSSYESDLEEELDGLINVETRHTGSVKRSAPAASKKNTLNSDYDFDLLSSLSDDEKADDFEPAQPTKHFTAESKKSSAEKPTGAARYKRNRM